PWPPFARSAPRAFRAATSDAPDPTVRPPALGRFASLGARVASAACGHASRSKRGRVAPATFAGWLGRAPTESIVKRLIVPLAVAGLLTLPVALAATAL